MARTPLTATQFGAAAGTAPVSQSTDATNGHIITVPSGTLGQTKGKVNLLTLRVANTAGTSQNVIVRANSAPAGTYYAPFHALSGQGDLTVAVAATTGVQYITGLSSARFGQDDGTLWVDYAAGFTGTIEVYCAPDPAV